MIDFQDFELPTTPNYFYAAPLNYSKAQPQLESPIYPVSLKQLTESFEEMVAQQPRLQTLAKRDTQFSYIQRTRWLHFPDYIDVILIALSAEQSTLAIYSRSKYGYYDFAVNEKRVKSWLQQLDDKIQPLHPSTDASSH